MGFKFSFMYVIWYILVGLIWVFLSALCCVAHMRATQGSQKEGIGSPGTRVTVGCEPGPLKVTTESISPPPMSYL